MSTVVEVDQSDTALPLNLTVDSNGGVTGLTPTVALRKLPSTDNYLDWADMTFKTVGWGVKYQTLNEVERGNYQLILNVAALALPEGTKLSAEYRAAGYGDDADQLIISKLRPQVTYLRKVATNRLEEASGVTGTLKLYDDDNATVIQTWALNDEAGGSILPTSGTPAKRGAGT
jgi:hypothetical protein